MALLLTGTVGEEPDTPEAIDSVHEAAICNFDKAVPVFGQEDAGLMYTKVAGGLASSKRMRL